MRLKVILAVLCWTGVCAAQTITGPGSARSVVLATSQAATGYSTRAIDVQEPVQSMVVIVSNTTGSVEARLEISCDRGVTWTPVDNATVTLATATDHIEVLAPQCAYALNIPTTCSTCSLSATAYLGPKVK